MSVYPAPSGLVASPCRSLCKLDADQFCTGCGRHIDHIQQWRTMSDAQRQVCVDQAAQRFKNRPPQSG